MMHATKPAQATIQMNIVHHQEPTVYTIADTTYEATSQNTNVQWYVDLLPSSAFAVATAAKQGIVVILNAMNAINPGIVIPVA